jgi:DNA polymerase III delta prime subunit
MSDLRPLPLWEALRPKTFQDFVTLPQSDINCIQRMSDTGELMNMLFYGPPGAGKTTLAKIIKKARGDFGTLEINGSAETGVDDVRNVIQGFAFTVAFTYGLKICFVDEADYLSKNAQAALRTVIERSARNCRFLFAVNNLSKIEPAIRSRLKLIDFNVPRADVPAVLERMQHWYSERLTELEMPFSRKRLDQIVSNYFPDFRMIANTIEYEFKWGA